MISGDDKQWRGELIKDYSLARHTSWRVGGRADQCYRPLDVTDLAHFLRYLPQDEPLTWLGLGSNVLIRDAGIAGSVILTLNRLNKITLLDNQYVCAEAGVTCAKLAKFCVKHGFEDGAFFAGIPGTVGGALAMNAGAFGGETWPHVVAAQMMQRDGHVHTLYPQDFSVAYRRVVRPKNEYFIAGLFRFQSGDVDKAQRHLKSLLKKRNNSQPIGTYSCGSVFRNPEGDYAARLVEASGLKGQQIGDATVSQKHANFILNNGKASAAHIEQLIQLVQQEVYQQQGVSLTPEVHVIGRS